MRIDPSMVAAVSGGINEATAAGGRPSRQERAPAADARIENAQGVTLYDIRGELAEAARDALASAGTEQAPASVEDALTTVLEENGFDVAEVLAALRGRSATFGEGGLREAAVEARSERPGVPLPTNEEPPPPAVDTSLPGPEFGVPELDLAGGDSVPQTAPSGFVAPDPADILVDAMMADLQPGSLVSIYA